MAWTIRVLLCASAGFFSPLAFSLALPQPRVAAQADAGVTDSERGRGEEALKKALARLKAPEPAERVSAADELGKRGQRFRHAISDALRPMLASDPEPVVRAAAGRALGRLVAREAVPELIAALGDRAAEVRVVAAAALWRLPDPAAVPALLTCASDADPVVREWSALALGVAADPRAAPVLVRLLSDPQRAVQLAAVRSLGRVRRAEALAPLVKYLKDAKRDEEEKDEAVNAIVSLDGGERQFALLELLAAPGIDARQRVRLSLALGKVGDAAAIEALRSLSRDKAASVREAAKHALADLQKRSKAAPPAVGVLPADAARP